MIECPFCNGDETKCDFSFATERCSQINHMNQHALHVIDYYLHLAVKAMSKATNNRHSIPDFDIETEQREGWAYDPL